MSTPLTPEQIEAVAVIAERFRKRMEALGFSVTASLERGPSITLIGLHEKDAVEAATLMTDVVRAALHQARAAAAVVEAAAWVRGNDRAWTTEDHEAYRRLTDALSAYRSSLTQEDG